MLVYRALSSNYNYCTYHNEIDAYTNGALCSLPSRLKFYNHNTFYYGNLKFFHHFFVFAEDATKFVLTKENAHDYQVGEFEMEDDLVPVYSGFGTGYEFTAIPNYVFRNCDEKKLKVQQIQKPAFEIALPTQQLKESFLVPPNYSILNNELCEEFKMEHYFQLSCIRPTGNLFEFGDERINTCYREIYEKYQEGLCNDFLKAYGIKFDEEQKKLISYPHQVTIENILSRKKVLQKNHLIK